MANDDLPEQAFYMVGSIDDREEAENYSNRA
jgi:F0F1-type ATP synthase beta subunit